MSREVFGYNFHFLFNSKKDVKKINKFLKSIGHDKLYITEECHSGYVRYSERCDRFFYGTCKSMHEWVPKDSILKEIIVEKVYKTRSAKRIP